MAIAETWLVNFHSVNTSFDSLFITENSFCEQIP